MRCGASGVSVEFLPNLVESPQPIAFDGAGDLCSVLLGVALEHFNNVCFCLVASGVKFQRHKLRDRDQAERAARVEAQLTAGERVVNGIRKLVGKADHLHQAE